MPTSADRSRPHRFFPARAWALAALSALALFSGRAEAQNDALVSKTVAAVLSDGEYFWALGDSGTSYSRIDFFSDWGNPRVTTRRAEGVGNALDGAAARPGGLLLWSNRRLRDTAKSDTVKSALFSLGRNDRITSDTITFVLPTPAGNAGGGGASRAAQGVRVSALAARDSLFAIGGGQAGFALLRLPAPAAGSAAPAAPLSGGPAFPASPPGPSPAAGAFSFASLPARSDSALSLLTCIRGAVCRTDTLARAGIPAFDSVTALAFSGRSPDSLFLLIGTARGLRRGLAQGRDFPRVDLPGTDDTTEAVQAIAADSASGRVFLFTRRRIFLSRNFGATFDSLVRPAGFEASPQVVLAPPFGSPPEVAFAGDSAYANLYLATPGLLLFRGDSLVLNRGNGPLARLLLDREDSVDFAVNQNVPTGLAFLRRGDRAVLAVGTAGRGLLYRRFSDSGAGAWENLTKQRAVKNALSEIITFPTLFDGSRNVGIGYRLRKDARVTITVRNYAMEKVRTVVRQSRRQGGRARSENPQEDSWDGKDDAGRFVSVGTYYILVETDSGERGWGKSIVVHGR